MEPVFAEYYGHDKANPSWVAREREQMHLDAELFQLSQHKKVVDITTLDALDKAKTTQHKVVLTDISQVCACHLLSRFSPSSHIFFCRLKWTRWRHTTMVSQLRRTALPL
jgi:hypothetical protein